MNWFISLCQNLHCGMKTKDAAISLNENNNLTAERYCKYLFLPLYKRKSKLRWIDTQYPPKCQECFILSKYVFDVILLCNFVNALLSGKNIKNGQIGDFCKIFWYCRKMVHSAGKIIRYFVLNGTFHFLWIILCQWKPLHHFFGPEITC